MSNNSEIERWNDFYKNMREKLCISETQENIIKNLWKDIRSQNYDCLVLPAIYGNGQYHDKDNTNLYISWNFNQSVFYFTIDLEDNNIIEWFYKNRETGFYDGGIYEPNNEEENENMWYFLHCCLDKASKECILVNENYH